MEGRHGQSIDKPPVYPGRRMLDSDEIFSWAEYCCWVSAVITPLFDMAEWAITLRGSGHRSDRNDRNLHFGSRLPSRVRHLHPQKPQK